MKNILIVEDDTLLNKTLAYNLTLDGYEITSAYTYSTAMRYLKTKEYDMVLLDINLPDGNGLDFCQEMKAREYETYILFLTAKDKESDILKGYEAGGIDYITKPFSIVVLCKKIAAIFDNINREKPKHDIYEDGNLFVDFSRQIATFKGENIDFTPKEYRTLRLFIKNSHIILTKRQLLEKLWDVDGNFVDEHTLTTIISRIRKKIETDECKYIKTAYGIGYQWIGGEIE